MNIKRTETYYEDGSADTELTKAWSFRIGRLEFCWGWFYGRAPTLFYFKPNGKYHKDATSTTFRVSKLMLGLRKYPK